jgi:hypothetical protein
MIVFAPLDLVPECRALVLLAAGLLSDKFRDDNDRESRYRDAESVRKKMRNWVMQDKFWHVGG